MTIIYRGQWCLPNKTIKSVYAQWLKYTNVQYFISKAYGSGKSRSEIGYLIMTN